MTSQLRAYKSRLWNSLTLLNNAAAGSDALAEAAAALLRQFWKHAPRLAVASPTLQQMILQDDNNNDASMQWARPMGLQVVLVSSSSTTTTTTNNYTHAPWQVHVVDPAGNIIKVPTPFINHNKNEFAILACLGRDHDTVRQALERKKQQQGTTNTLHDSDDDEWLQKVIFPTLAEGLSTASLQCVHIQTLSADGLLTPVQIIVNAKE